MKSFDFVVACQVLVEAWDALTPENIQKCLSKAGFMPYVEHEPESYAEPSPPLHNIWDDLQCVLGVNGPFAHDDRAESSERMDDAAIIKAVASKCETVAVDENEDPDASDSEKELLNVMTQEKLGKKKLSRHLLSFCALLHSRRLTFSIINYQRAF